MTSPPRNPPRWARTGVTLAWAHFTSKGGEGTEGGEAKVAEVKEPKGPGPNKKKKKTVRPGCEPGPPDHPPT